MRSRVALLAVIGLLVLAGGCTRTPPGARQAALRAAVGDAPVVLLSAAWCGYCRRLRADLTAWGVPFTEFDVERSEPGRRALALLPGSGVPVLLVGTQRIAGYAPNRIRNALEDEALWPAAAVN